MDELIDGMWTRRVDVFCDGCGAAIPENISPISLRDGSLLCPTCERRVRIRFPKMGREDPLKLLSLPDYLREREEIGEYRESLRKRYEGADAVFVAEEIKHQGAILHPSTWRVYGRVVYGKFYSGDLALAKNAGREKMVKLREIYSLSDSGWLNRGEVGFLGRQRGPGEAAGIEGKSRASLCEAVEGYTYELVLRERGLNLFPGDLFIKREKWSRL